MQEQRVVDAVGEEVAGVTIALSSPFVLSAGCGGNWCLYLISDWQPFAFLDSPLVHILSHSCPLALHSPAFSH